MKWLMYIVLSCLNWMTTSVDHLAGLEEPWIVVVKVGRVCEINSVGRGAISWFLVGFIQIDCPFHYPLTPIQPSCSSAFF